MPCWIPRFIKEWEAPAVQLFQLLKPVLRQASLSISSLPLPIPLVSRRDLSQYGRSPPFSNHHHPMRHAPYIMSPVLATHGSFSTNRARSAHIQARPIARMAIDFIDWQSERRSRPDPTFPPCSSPADAAGGKFRFLREGSPCDLPLLHPPKDPDEYGVDVRDTPLNREDIKEGVKHLVDLNPPVLRQKDRGENLARTSGRFPLPMAPGIFQFPPPFGQFSCCRHHREYPGNHRRCPGTRTNGAQKPVCGQRNTAPTRSDPAFS